MEYPLGGVFFALWLGVLTSISPCPLAANIAAIAFLSKKIAHPRLVFWSGLAYTLGRMLAYAIVGMLLISSLLSVPALANWLQKYVNRVLGPVLILSGLFLLGVIRFRLPKLSLKQEHHDALAGSGAAGALALGFIFALAFCPTAAALFFGSLIPFALAQPYPGVFPLVYGIGSALPVVVFTVAIALGVRSLERWCSWLSKLEYCLSKATGAIFVLVGGYYTLAYLLRRL